MNEAALVALNGNDGVDRLEVTISRYYDARRRDSSPSVKFIAMQDAQAQRREKMARRAPKVASDMQASRAQRLEVHPYRIPTS